MYVPNDNYLDAIDDFINIIQEDQNLQKVQIYLVRCKIDRSDYEESKEFRKEIKKREAKIGYPSFRISSLTGEGIEEMMNIISYKNL